MYGVRRTTFKTIQTQLTNISSLVVDFADVVMLLEDGIMVVPSTREATRPAAKTKLYGRVTDTDVPDYGVFNELFAVASAGSGLVSGYGRDTLVPDDAMCDDGRQTPRRRPLFGQRPAEDNNSSDRPRLYTPV